MYFQFLIEDQSTEVLVRHIMEKLLMEYSEKEIFYDCKSFRGIGHLVKGGGPLDQKTGKLLNDLPLYLRAFDKRLRSLSHAALIIVLDNDKRNPKEFQTQLENLSKSNMVLLDHVFCIAVKEMEAWLLGDIHAMELAYPQMKKNALRSYVQDGICDTWEVLANAVYPGGMVELKKKAENSYTAIGRAKFEWADKIGKVLTLRENHSPSFQYFIRELVCRIETA